MLILLIGTSNSGKSRFAEKIASRFPGPRIYAATMVPCGAAGAARVDKHRRQRAGRGFVTVECPRGLDGISAGKNALVLLDLEKEQQYWESVTGWLLKITEEREPDEVVAA